MKPNQSMIDMWTRAADSYHESLPGSPAEEYLDKRGLLAGATQFRLGYVETVAPGHEDRFKGTLSVPYLTPSGVVAWKFRRLVDDGLPKYDSPAGQRHHLYNVMSLHKSVSWILVVEGELDAVAATLAGFPAVASPGVNGWKPHFTRCFDGFNKVVVVTDNDQKNDDGRNPGEEFGRFLTETIPNAIRVSLPAGEDVNSTITNYGIEHFSELIGQQLETK